MTDHAALRREADELLAKLAKASPGNLESAETRDEDSYECPACGGEGSVDGVTYTNYDGLAVGVQFFGVGPEHVANEEAYRALPETRAVIRRLLDALQWPPCKGIPDPDCQYLARCDGPCNKCGREHRHHLLMTQQSQPERPAPGDERGEFEKWALEFREEVLRAVNTLDTLCRRPGNDPGFMGVMIRLREAYTEAVRAANRRTSPAAPAVDVQAVAWQHRVTIGGRWSTWRHATDDEVAARDGMPANLIQFRPLYTSDQLSALIAQAVAEDRKNRACREP